MKKKNVINFSVELNLCLVQFERERSFILMSDMNARIENVMEL